MGIYFLIAIAFSAITAAHDVQGARPRLAYVQRVRAERRVIRTASRRIFDGGQVPRLSGQAWAPVLHWRGFSAAPRAPAFGC
jgi:hypothetical protein